MTNAQIIEKEAERLVKEGLLDLVQVQIGGEVLEIPEELKTFRAWKKSGYSVKKGEKSIASFKIWKSKTKRLKLKDGKSVEDEVNGTDVTDFFLTNAHFFKKSQVEKI